MPRRMIAITNVNGTIVAKVPTDADEHRRHLTIERGGNAVYGIEITTDGTVVVGYWEDGKHWKTLHTDAPEEP